MVSDFVCQLEYPHDFTLVHHSTKVELLRRNWLPVARVLVCKDQEALLLLVGIITTLVEDGIISEKVIHLHDLPVWAELERI